MARWLQSTVVGAINAELRDPAIPVADAQFNRSGNARDFWTERVYFRLSSGMKVTGESGKGS